MTLWVSTSPGKARPAQPSDEPPSKAPWTNPRFLHSQSPCPQEPRRASLLWTVPMVQPPAGDEEQLAQGHRAKTGGAGLLSLSRHQV